MSVNDLSTGMINVHNSTSLFKNIISGGAGVLCHEFLHTVGYPDLYRNSSRTGTPVGLWDIMASNSVFVQYPLAYQRYKVSGWLDAKTITEDGTYTLSPASARNGNRLYLRAILKRVGANHFKPFVERDGSQSRVVSEGRAQNVL